MNVKPVYNSAINVLPKAIYQVLADTGLNKHNDSAPAELKKQT